MFHPWKKWEPMVSFLKKPTLSVVKIHPWHRDCSKQTYSKFSNQVCYPIVKFLTGEDLQEQPTEVFKKKPNAMKAADGSNVTAMDNIIIGSKLTEDDIALICNEPDQQKEAIKEYQKLKSS